MTDKIDTAIAAIMANRASAAGDSQRHDSDIEHEADVRVAAAAAATNASKDLRNRIATFVTALNTKLEPAQIDVELVGMESDPDAHLISEYKAQFGLSSQAVDYNVRTIFKAHTNGQIDIYVAAVSDTAPRKTFEFRTETMSDDDITDVFAKFLEIGTKPAS